ncbi:hypothetical protein GCM10029992_07710 [Glycomyces albus]
MITRIEAQNYRCFRNLAVDLERYQVLAGANGAGKTTFLDIPSLLGDLLSTRRVSEAFLERRHPQLAPRAHARRTAPPGSGPLVLVRGRSAAV